MEIKGICSKCAGVIGGDITDYSSGEYPCSCGKVSKNWPVINSILQSWLKKKQQKKRRQKLAEELGELATWKNGREVHNSEGSE